MQRIFALIASKRFDPTLMTTQTLPFSEVSEAFRLMEAKEDGVIKPLITF